MTSLETYVLAELKTAGPHKCRKYYESQVVEALANEDYILVSKYNAKLAILAEICGRYNIVPVTKDGFMCEPCAAHSFQLYERR